MKKPSFAKLAQRRQHLYPLVDRVKLWPSRTGRLHGVRSLDIEGEWISIETHCGEHFRVRNSKSARGKRQIKHGHYKTICKKCGIPDWKIDKFKQSVRK